MFIGRQNGLKKLLDIVKSDFKEFVPIIGKRGVGKTALLEKLKMLVLQNPDYEVLEVVGRKSSPNKEQLKKVAKDFSEQLKETFSAKSWDVFLLILMLM